MTMEFINILTGIVGKDAVRFDEPMSLHTTFRIGGPADLFVIPPDEQSLVKAVECCKQWEIPWMIIGNGSNLLVGDKGIRALFFRFFRPWIRCLLKGWMAVRSVFKQGLGSYCPACPV